MSNESNESTRLVIYGYKVLNAEDITERQKERERETPPTRIHTVHGNIVTSVVSI